MTDADVARSLTEEAAVPWWRKRWVLAGLAPLVLALAAAWYGFVYFAADHRLNVALAAAEALDPGWRLEELEVKRAILADEENAGVCVLAAKKLLPAQWPAWEQPAADP